MTFRRLIATAALAVAALGSVPSFANEPDCSAAAGSAATPHQVDRTGDALTADTDDALVAQDTTDIRAAWFSVEGDVLRAHIQTTKLHGTETNQIFYVMWTYKGAEDAKFQRRFVSAQPRPEVPGVYGGAYRYGYLDETTPGVSTLTNQGYTTGRAKAGTPGEVIIDIPLDKLGNPGEGEILENVVAESRLLVGPPGHGQQHVTTTGAAGGGLVSVLDDTGDAEGCNEIIL